MRGLLERTIASARDESRRGPVDIMAITTQQLRQRQSLPIDIKIAMSMARIRAWHEYWCGDVYVSFSGGKDSTVLLDLVRSEFPDVPAVFVDTGLEYPEIREFVKTVDNVVWLKPAISFKKVIEKYGYPVISKKIAMGVSRYRNTKSKLQKKLRLYGGINPTSGKQQHPTISQKWHYLIDAPFKCSEQCCRVIKKQPIKQYNKTSGRKAIIGTMASESRLRQMSYLQQGCNSFESKNPTSSPIAFWKEADIWDYIKAQNIPYCKIYDSGINRTGCMFCMFGVHLEESPNRFQQMAKTHPAQYDYCINKLGCGRVLDYINVKH